MNVGDQILLSGGYEYEPVWYGPRQQRIGRVTAFIPGQNQLPAAVVELDEPVRAEGIEGRIVVLELRYANAVWRRSETVHVELCDFVPEPHPWIARRQGKWIESNATYRKL